MNDASAIAISRPWIGVSMLAAWAAAVAIVPDPLVALALAAPVLAAPCAWRLIASRGAWLAIFFVIAILAPPLPIPLGDSGPHLALAIAPLGVAAGALRLAQWRFKRDLLSGALIVWPAVLLFSVGLAALYSGPAIALASFARVGLFGIAVYVYFYTAHGPGRFVELPRGFLFAIGGLAAAFACADFYFQLPAPAGYGPQFVWLETGPFRRAQGMFYEATTLGNFCAFFLVGIAAALIGGARRRMLLAIAAILLGAALVFSYSRASAGNLAVSLVALAWLNRSRTGVRRLLLALPAMAIVLIAVVLWLAPAFAALYWTRLTRTVIFFGEAMNTVLSGRLETWRTLGEFLIANPWHAILGVGYKTLPYSDFTGRPIIADNMFLGILVEAGIPGLAALILLNAAILRAAWRARDNFWGAWIFCFWIGEIAQMFSSDVLTFWRVLPLYFWVLARAVRT